MFLSSWNSKLRLDFPLLKTWAGVRDSVIIWRKPTFYRYLRQKGISKFKSDNIFTIATKSGIHALREVNLW